MLIIIPAVLLASLLSVAVFRAVRRRIERRRRAEERAEERARWEEEEIFTSWGFPDLLDEVDDETDPLLKKIEWVKKTAEEHPEDAAWIIRILLLEDPAAEQAANELGRKNKIP